MASPVKDRTAGEIMNTRVLPVQEDWPVDKLADFLVENSISGAPVTSTDGRLVGVVSVTDIVRHRSVPVKESHGAHEVYVHQLERSFAREEIEAFRFGRQASTEVGDIMTPMVFQVAESTRIGDVADQMVRGRIHRVFVTCDDRVVGIITALDLLKVLSEG